MTASVEQLEAETRSFREGLDRLSDHISSVVVGQRQVIDDVICGIVASGHVLLEGAPGLGKTLLVRTLSESVELSFARVQFTPDLMPADITGTNVVVEEDGQRSFRFQKGPVFTNVLLADEINRATPKTQSALLEAMQEHAVTVAGHRHALPAPHFVLATQNPIEMEGTYPLPEAQLDRFILKIVVPFPKRDELAQVIDLTTGGHKATSSRILSSADLLQYQALAREVVLAPEVRDHAADLVLATHPDSNGAKDIVKRYVRYGASPRGAQALVQCAKVRALRAGRAQVDFKDINALAMATLRHRIILNFEGEAEGISTDHVIQAILS